MGKPRKEPAIWQEHHDALFFELWEKHSDGLKSLQNNTHIYKLIFEKLRKAGYEGQDWKCVRAKMDNLKRKYKTELRHQRLSCIPSTWRYFDRVRKIVGAEQLITVPVSVMESTDGEPSSLPSSAHIKEELIIEDMDCDNLSTTEASTKSVSYSKRSRESSELDFDEDFANIPVAENTAATHMKKTRLTAVKAKQDSPSAASADKSKSSITAFESKIIECMESRTAVLMQLATERLEVLKNMLQENADFHSKILERLPPIIEKHDNDK